MEKLYNVVDKMVQAAFYALAASLFFSVVVIAIAIGQ